MYKYVTVKTDQSKNYYFYEEAIKDHGFEEAINERENEIEVIVRGKERSLFTKDGKYYIPVSFNHFNTQFFSFKMREVERGQYKEI